MNKKTLVVLSGAGISAESGIMTFRDAQGLWEKHDIMEVASPMGFAKHPELVLRFYNERRRQARQCRPNAGHIALKDLETGYRVRIITQNVDNLHEQAGSSEILHLHGELFKARSTGDASLVYDMDTDEINLGDTCEKGFQLRPHIVWFHEEVPAFADALQWVSEADILIVTGTSLQVYPANTLMDYVPRTCSIYLVDPVRPDYASRFGYTYIQETATEGLPALANDLLKEVHR